MATSVTLIANQALSAMGARAVTSDIFTENTPQAIQARTWWDSTRLLVARAANWQFNKKTALGALLKAAPGTPENPSGGTGIWSAAQPPPPWLYAYAYPQDCLRARYLQGQFQPNAGISPPLFSAPVGTYPYRDSGYAPFTEASDQADDGSYRKVLLTNQTQALITYTVDVQDPNVWDQGFIDAMIYGLAARLCMGISGKEQTMINLYKIANQKLAEAQAMDANEQTNIDDHTPDWIAVRTGLPYGGAVSNGWILAPYGPLFTALS